MTDYLGNFTSVESDTEYSIKEGKWQEDTPSPLPFDGQAGKNMTTLYRVTTRSVPMDYRSTGSRFTVIHTTDWNTAFSVFTRIAEKHKDPEYGTVSIEAVEMDAEGAAFNTVVTTEWKYVGGEWIQGKVAQ